MKNVNTYGNILQLKILHLELQTAEVLKPKSVANFILFFFDKTKFLHTCFHPVYPKSHYECRNLVSIQHNCFLNTSVSIKIGVLLCNFSTKSMIIRTSPYPDFRGLTAHWEYSIHSTSQDIFHIPENREFYYSVYKIPTLVLILNDINGVATLTPCF